MKKKYLKVWPVGCEGPDHCGKFGLCLPRYARLASPRAREGDERRAGIGRSADSDRLQSVEFHPLDPSSARLIFFPLFRS